MKTNIKELIRNRDSQIDIALDALIKIIEYQGAEGEPKPFEIAKKAIEEMRRKHKELDV